MDGTIECGVILDDPPH